MRGWQLEYPAGLIPVNSAIVNDQDCYLYIEPDLTSAVIPWGQSYQLDYAVNLEFFVRYGLWSSGLGLNRLFDDPSIASWRSNTERSDSSPQSCGGGRL